MLIKSILYGLLLAVFSIVPFAGGQVFAQAPYDEDDDDMHEDNVAWYGGWRGGWRGYGYGGYYRPYYYRYYYNPYYYGYPSYRYYRWY